MKPAKYVSAKPGSFHSLGGIGRPMKPGDLVKPSFERITLDPTTDYSDLTNYIGWEADSGIVGTVLETFHDKNMPEDFGYRWVKVLHPEGVGYCHDDELLVLDLEDR